MAPLAYDPIMSGRSIQSFRHLKHLNQSIISDSRGILRWLRENGEKIEEEEQEE